MEAIDSGIHQVLVKFLDGKHKFLNFDSSSISIPILKDQIQRITSIPSDLQLLLSHNSHVLHDHQTLDFDSDSYENTQFRKTPDFDSNSQYDTGLPEKSTDGSRNFPVVVHLLLRLRGGKGGFGSLLRGAATKAGQKKTNNFDACRDMSGRRLRHVNAEKKLEEWRAEVQERKLEKMAEDYIKKRTKEALKKGKSSQGEISQKYVMKYQEDSAKCMEEVDRSVKESIKELLSSKRKKDAEASESDSKRLKIWLGKKILDDSDSEDMDDDDSDGDEEEKEMSVVIDNDNHSDSSKEADGSSGSITGGKIDSDKGSSGLGSEEEDIVAEESPKSGQRVDACANNSDGENKIESSPEIPEEFADRGVVEKEVPQECESCEVEEISGQLTGVSTSSEEEGASASEVTKSADPQPGQEERVSGNVEPPVSDEPLNFDEFNSAAELKVLGLERLKTELQARGLKCGGTLQERAARLFLLKTTPLEKLPKKLFAKK